MIYGVGFPGGTGGGKNPQIVGGCMGITPYVNRTDSAKKVTQTYTISYREGYDSYDFLVITPQVPPTFAYKAATDSSPIAGGPSNGNTENIIIKGSGRLLLYTLRHPNENVGIGTYSIQDWQYQATDTDITLTASTNYNQGGYFSCVAYKY